MSSFRFDPLTGHLVPASPSGSSSGGGGSSTSAVTARRLSSDKVAVATVQAFRAVAVDDQDRIYPCDAYTAADAARFLGVSLAAALPGETTTVVQAGQFSGGTWTAGPLFVGDQGALVASPPAGAAFQLNVGTATSSSAALVRPQTPIYL